LQTNLVTPELLREIYMPTDQQISILTDVASNGGSGLSPEKLSDLLDLVASGYVESEGDSERYKLTAKGQGVLAERGVGVNES
jgi:predicted transcriptional regulator